MKTLDAGYFLEAMELYREKFKRVVFVYVTDDIEWGRQKLGRKSGSFHKYFILININFVP